MENRCLTFLRIRAALLRALDNFLHHLQTAVQVRIRRGSHHFAVAVAEGLLLLFSYLHQRLLAARAAPKRPLDRTHCGRIHLNGFLFYIEVKFVVPVAADPLDSLFVQTAIARLCMRFRGARGISVRCVRFSCSSPRSVAGLRIRCLCSRGNGWK